jgi:excisionase family DNA binding protein
MASSKLDEVHMIASASAFVPEGVTSLSDPLLTSAESAEILGTSEPTFWRWVREKRVPPAVKLGGLSRWPRSEILNVIEKAKAARFVSPEAA